MVRERIEGLDYVNLCAQLIFFIVDVLITWGLWFFIFSKVFHVKILVSMSLYHYLIFWLVYVGLWNFHWVILLIDRDYELELDHLSVERVKYFGFDIDVNGHVKMWIWVEAMSYTSWLGSVDSFAYDWHWLSCWESVGASIIACDLLAC